MLAVSLIGVLLGVSTVYAHVDTLKHDIFTVTPQKFDQVIGKFRNDHVAAVVMFDKSKESKSAIEGFYNEAAEQLKGMVKVAAVDCDAHGPFCKSYNVEKFPSLVVVPPNPQPSYVYQGEKTKAALVSHLITLIPGNHIRRLTVDNVDLFLSEGAGVPKAVLFPSKEGSPLYKALSNAFSDRMSFGVVPKSEEAIAVRFGVKKFPYLILVKGDVKKPDVYSGELKFRPMHEWLNIRSETFVKGGGFSHSTNLEQEKPWLVQSLPEVTQESHQDVCFRTKGLCVMYLTDKPALAANEVVMLENMKSQFVSQLSDRGATYKWMWMNVNLNKEWKEMLSLESIPAAVVFNPHNRVRYMKMEGAPTEEKFSELLNKIEGGDGRFTTVKGGKLPRFEKPVKDEL